MKGIELFNSLEDLVNQVDNFDGPWLATPEKVENKDGTISFGLQGPKLAWDVNRYLWEYSGQYTPATDGNWQNDKHDHKYPTINHWDTKLQEVMDKDSFNTLSKDEVYDFIFGLHHRNRINDGLWCSMFDRGVMQKLLHRLLELENQK